MTFNNLHVGPILEIGISPTLGSAHPPIPPLTTAWIQAIADTGATQTCVGSRAAQRAGLPVIGKTQMQSASHLVPVNVFFGDLWLKCQFPGGVPFVWRLHDRTFLELTLPGTGNEALLGMDIFSMGLLMVHGPEKKTTFSW